MKRILIIGCSGAGKTTLSLRLKNILNLPLIHLDREYWNEGWVESDKAQWKQKIQEMIRHEQWIMDGNYGGTMDIRMERADTIAFLYYPTWLCLWRVIKRTMKYYGRSRPDMAEGCEERWSWQFIRYVWNYNQTRAPKILKKLEGLEQEKEIMIFRKPKDTSTFMEGLIASRG